MSLYAITRTSDPYGYEPPCDGAHRRDLSLKNSDITMASWVMDIKDLCDFVKENGEIILQESDYKEVPFEVEIYDDYRE